MAAVHRLIKLLVDKETFCFSSIKRTRRSFVAKRCDEEILLGMDKPDGNDVVSMFRPDMFESGEKELP